MKMIVEMPEDWIKDLGKGSSEFVLEHAYDMWKMVADATPFTEAEDCIEREEAILSIWGKWNESRDEMAERIERTLKALPPVTPKLEECEYCISRDELKNELMLDIPEQDSGLYSDLCNIIDLLPPVTQKQSFEGMTNGEVIKALFPYVEAEETPHLEVIETNLDQDFAYTLFQKKWWNAPYNGGEQE
jgi:hypothetical protein